MIAPQSGHRLSKVCFRAEGKIVIVWLNGRLAVERFAIGFLIGRLNFIGRHFSPVLEADRP